MFCKDATSSEDSQSSKQGAMTRKRRKRKNCRTKSNAKVESDQSDSNYEAHSTKSKDRTEVKNSSKQGSQSSEMELKIIQTKRLLLMLERVERCQVAFDECHQAKLSGEVDIQQSSISSDPNAMTNCSAAQVSTQWSEHAKNVQGSQPSTVTSKKLDSKTNQSAAQVMKHLAYKIPEAIHQVIAPSTSKDKTEDG